MDYINAFWVGGLICALAQILLDRTKMMPGRVMVSLVVLGCILGFVQIFKPLQEYAGAGVSVPLLGFGNTLWNGVKEAVDISAPVGTKRILFHSPDISCGIIYAARVIAAQPQPLPPELVCCVC